jgi:hypothetical protein
MTRVAARVLWENVLTQLEKSEKGTLVMTPRTPLETSTAL